MHEAQRAGACYLTQAKLVDDSAAHEQLDGSPCYASGEILFSDGRTGQWSVDQYLVGSLVIGDGPRMTLYCPRCRFRPFASP
jgi:hypothetical protein